MSETTTQDAKAAVRQMADALPDNATWDDVMYRVYVSTSDRPSMPVCETRPKGVWWTSPKSAVSLDWWNEVSVLAVIHAARLLPPTPLLDA
jgi:hypothetical protein